MEQKKIFDYVYMIVGPVLMAFAVKFIYQPAGMVTGGVSGIAIIVQNVTAVDGAKGISIGLTNILINSVVFVIAYLVLGRKTVMNVLLSTIIFSIALFFIPSPDNVFETFAMSSVFGGIINGIGLGLVFIAGASTGGTELISAILHKKIRSISMTSILLVIEAIVVLTGYFVFGSRPTFYSIIAIAVSMKTADIVMAGFNYCKMVYVISYKCNEISERIIENMHRGVTGIDVKGMYTGSKKMMLLCIIKPRELSKLQDIVSEIDNTAFVIISEARKVMGEGFINNSLQ